LVTAVAFLGSISWTVYLSFTASRRFPDYQLVGFKQYSRLFADDNWNIALWNMVIFGLGSLASIVIGFVLAALIDREERGAAVFRTIFLYPLSISLIVTGIAWRWMFDPNLGVEGFLHSIGWTSAHFHWLSSPRTVMGGIILASVWQNTGFFMALLIAGLKSINPEIWRAGRLDGVAFWRFYAEIIIPMMKFTFVTCGILVAIHMVKAYDIVVAMTRGGPGSSSYLPAYFTINAYWERSNLGYASAAAAIMLLMTLAVFGPFLVYRVWRRKPV
jgi:glucose/mannose transport system permease protein